jgi:signal transduction histidine kinase
MTWTRHDLMRVQGTGPGISICKHVLELMQGTITVHSEKNVGTTVLITLPLAQTTINPEDEDAASRLIARLDCAQ